MFKKLESWLNMKREPHREEKTRCLECGKCCESFGGHLHASGTDLERWRLMGREDLLSRVNRLGWIWVDPETKHLEERCPFLKQTGPETRICEIYEIRPDICRAYPTLAHGRRCLRGGFLKIWIVASGGAVWEYDTVASALSVHESSALLM